MDIDAPPLWQCVDFISDLHLQANAPQTLATLQRYLLATPAHALFILGDLFEVWVGDDCLDERNSFAAQCAALLHGASQHLQLYVMVGNRDFLLGPRMLQACGAQGVSDPSILAFCGQRWLLTHGDALCLDDLPYQQFRAQVRSAAWQSTFLAQPLAQRQRIASDIRAQSESNKRQTAHYVDLDSTACEQWLQTHQARHMVHGHTHQPGCHLLNDGATRSVLSDWDSEAHPPRADVLRLSRHHDQGRSLQRLSPDDAAQPVPTR